jgi:DNA-binding GntR family transcriptional regulator
MAPPTSPATPDGRSDAAFEPISVVIFRGIRDLILSGELEPGSRIGQEAIAEQYGVSRLPVREALRLLESAGLATLVPHSGARVARVDLAECVELYRLREAVEPLLIDESVRHLTPEQRDEIAERARRVEASAGDRTTWLEEDRQFHLATFQGAKMGHARELVQRFWNQTQQYRRAHISGMTPEQLEIVHIEHRLIVDAIRRGDAEDAADRQRAHIRRTRVDLAAREEQTRADEAPKRRRRGPKPAAADAGDPEPAAGVAPASSTPRPSEAP